MRRQLSARFALAFALTVGLGGIASVLGFRWLSAEDRRRVADTTAGDVRQHLQWVLESWGADAARLKAQIDFMRLLSGDDPQRWLRLHAYLAVQEGDVANRDTVLIYRGDGSAPFGYGPESAQREAVRFDQLPGPWFLSPAPQQTGPTPVSPSGVGGPSTGAGRAVVTDLSGPALSPAPQQTGPTPVSPSGVEGPSTGAGRADLRGAEPSPSPPTLHRVMRLSLWLGADGVGTLVVLRPVEASTLRPMAPPEVELRLLEGERVIGSSRGRGWDDAAGEPDAALEIRALSLDGGGAPAPVRLELRQTFREPRSSPGLFAVAAVALLALLSLTLWLVLGRWLREVTRRIGSLTEASERFASARTVEAGVRQALGDALGRDDEIAAVAISALSMMGSVERDQAERLASEERYRIVGDFSADWEYWRADDGQILYMSPSCQDVSGYSREAFLAEPQLLERVVHPEDGAFRAHLQEERRGAEGAALTFRLTHQDGSTRWVGHRCRAVQAADGRRLGCRGSNRDVTEAVEQSERLRQSELRLLESQRVSRVGSFAIDVASGTWQGSEVLDELLGIGPSYRRDLSGLLQLVHPEGRASVAAHLQEALAGAAPFDQEFAVVRLSDGKQRRVHGRALATRDGAGAVVRLAGTVQDVTEHRLLEEQLFHAQKLEAVGQLAGGVAHDFNNLLAVIMMQVGMLERSAGLSADARECVAEIDAGARRAADLTRQLLVFGRRQVMKVQRRDLNELLEAPVKMLQRLLGEGISLELTLAPEPLWVDADQGMIEQLVVNLCVNARDAMPNGGRVVLGTRRLADGRAELSVADTGHGIDADTRPHLFEPFFTTKPQGQGTGLGLAIVHGVVKQHKGEIAVESQPGQGACFRVRLPLSTLAARAPAAAPAPLQRRGDESVLLVEDEAPLRHSVARWLRLLGYRVTEAGDAREALAICQRAEAPFDLVLTDMLMPGGLTGLELIRALRQLRPALCVLLMSGYSGDTLGTLPPASERIHFIAKPFELNALEAAVRACLDEAAGAVAWPRASQR